MRRMYRVTWFLDGGRKLVRLIPADSPEQAKRRASAESFQREVFRNANMMQRHPRSAYEYMDKAPRVRSIEVSTKPVR